MLIDLVMWTLNSEKTLFKCLESIDKAIPSEVVNQKIIVDAHSKDRTVEIAQKFGWDVYPAQKIGIPFQANQGLKKVRTKFFASFEHDIILSPQWLGKVQKFVSIPNVAIIQGIRLSTHPIMRKIETYAYKRRGRPHISLDNTLYRTEVLRKIGGFSEECPSSVDLELFDRLSKQGYKWITDHTIISNHLKENLRAIGEHNYQLALKSKHENRFQQWNLRFQLALFLFSFFRSISIIVETLDPRIMYAYPYIRFCVLKATVQKGKKRE